MDSPAGSWNEPTEPAADLSVSGLVAAVRRRFWLIAAWVLVCMAATLLLVTTLQPRYRSESLLLLDARVQQVSDLKSVVPSLFSTQDAAPVMRSEVQVAQSRRIAAGVIDQLDLGSNPAFLEPPSGPSRLMAATARGVRALCVGWAPSLCAEGEPPRSDAAERARIALVNNYLSRLSVINDGKSFTLSIAFEHRDPNLASLIVNTHAQVYVAEQRAFKRLTAERGGAWIEQQIARMGANVAVRERELADFRETSGLVAAQGATLVAQQVTQIGIQLAQARADLAQRQAQLAGAEGASRRGATAGQSEVLASPLIQRLREQEATAQRDLADLVQRYGPSYSGVQQAAARLEEASRKVASESQRILVASGGDAGVAQQRVRGLEENLQQLERRLVQQERAAARFAEMERDVAAVRAVYQGLLGRQQELAASAGTEDADARVISPAVPALAPFFPNKTMLLAVALLLSGAVGVGLSVLMGARGRGFETLVQLEAAVGPLAMHPLPFVARRRRGRRSLPDDVLASPKSEFAEALRFLRGDLAQTRRGKPCQVFAVTSALPREGKTTIAVCLARSMAASGLHVLLIDADLRRPQVARAVGVRPGAQGLVSVLQGRASLADAIVVDERTTLEVLAAGQAVDAPQDLLGSKAFSGLIAAARAAYDIVVLDTPPHSAVSDALVIAPQVDATFLVVRWKGTPASIVRTTMQAFDRRGVPLSGVFLNAVDQRALVRTDPDLRVAYDLSRDYYVRT